MNKLIRLTIAAAIAAAFTSAAVAQPLPLNEVIERSARGVEEALPQGAMVAILNFTSPSEAFSGHVIEELISELSEAGKISVVDRQNLEHITQEMVLQLSGAVSDESMLSVGRMLGAHYIISGTLTEMGAYYRFRIRIINIETAAIQRQITNELKKDTQVAFLMGGASAQQEAQQRELEIEREERRIERSRPTSNVKDNWVSGELSGGYFLYQGTGLSVGARYERMLNSKISLGANFYWFIPGGLNSYGFIDNSYVDLYDGLERDDVFGIDAFIRFYPTGKKFFLGLGLGYHDDGNYIEGWDDGDGGGKGKIYVAHNAGLAGTAELGFKIDVGKESGFFLQYGFLGTFSIGKSEYSYFNVNPSHSDIEDEERMFFGGYWRLYFGVGWAF